MNPTQQPQLVRAIGRWSLVGLVLNSIIGSGIFGLPSIVVGLVGPASLYGYLLAALGIGIIMACFAEVGSQFPSSGGPYLYVRESFGRFLGIQMAWMAWLVRVTASAAGANLFIIYLGEFWPAAGQPFIRLCILSAIIGFLALINVRGVSAGATLSSLFAIAKLIPLALFIGIGLFKLESITQPPVVATVTDWLKALLMLVFAFGGFEAALMPMAEAKNPRRDVPVALFIGLGVCTLFFALIHLVVLFTLPEAATSQRPLADAARRFLGNPGAALIAVGAMISVYGYLSSQMLNSPRVTFALAERGDFPAIFGSIHPRFRTPQFSISVFALALWGLAIGGTFQWNVFLSAVARLSTYGLVCAALLRLRWKHPEKDAFRMPLGRLLGVLGVAFTLILVSQMGWKELAVIGGLALLASINWWWASRSDRRLGQVIRDA